MTKKTKRNIERYLRRTMANKICSLLIVLIGVLTTLISNDITVLVFILMIAIPLFISDENWMSL